MNSREKFLATMNFDTSVSPPLWEMGYWAQTVRRWCREGLPRIKGVPNALRSGDSVSGPLSINKDKWCGDVETALGFDKGALRFPVENWIFPKFEEKILEEGDDRMIVIDEMGIKKKIGKGNDSIPEYLEWPVKNREDWEKLKSERLNPKTPGRYPANLNEIIEKLKQRDHPILLGSLPVGFFGSLRFLLGEVKLFMSYYDNPNLLKDIIDYLVDFWMELWSPVLSKIKIDWVNIWEDMCYKTGPLISPELFREFMLPAYKKFTGFLTDNGVENIIVDTDGNCWKLIPLFIEGGVTGLFPMEVAAGMNIVEVRKEFPKLQIIGGIDKRALARGKEEIDRELESKIPFMLKKGGYIPCVDHHIPPDVSWDNFVYYRRRLEKMVSAQRGITSGLTG